MTDTLPLLLPDVPGKVRVRDRAQGGRPVNADLTPEGLAELRRLLDECKPGRVVVNDLRPTHNAIWLDSRYDSDDGWERLRTLAEIDTETETVEVMWGLDDAILIAAAVNALPALLDAAAERDALAAKVEALADWHETEADKARRFRIEIDGRNPVMDKAAEVHTDAARRLRAVLDEEPQP